MDRKEAQNHIGKQVLIDEAIKGQYVGELIDVVAEPRKPWRGIVKIKGVDEFPSLQINSEGHCKLQEPIYSVGDVAEFASTKIKPLPAPFESSFEQSVIDSIYKKLSSYEQTTSQYEHLISHLTDYLETNYPNQIDPNKLKHKQTNRNQQYVEQDFDENYILYVVQDNHAEVILYDEDKKQHLVLEGCPFEFEVKHGNEWVTGHYLSNWKFQTSDNSVITLTPNQKIRLHKKQFEPYHILIKELENPARLSLEKSLKNFGMTHNHAVDCHNSLLFKLLHSTEENKFSGVNFITYKRKQKTIVVQHHYERELIENDNDVIYDRFEFTTDSGQRSIITYTNSYSKDR
ncbi:DUF2777 family protein [Desertibacillus haloalkaliphilus]|uniref:DUF2777 family protein n=1 Tax=Desertibacillus haloalkaliphilus TaxID=1328930 RepID=UPI001C25AC4B|nr:DUF2777 family protein [Desertibacillus haloalkaliphilus]MBU8907320.1 DUF2777 domain-containing protein [Desertibacillus haloalkaliphilus]